MTVTSIHLLGSNATVKIERSRTEDGQHRLSIRVANDDGDYWLSIMTAERVEIPEAVEVKR